MVIYITVTSKADYDFYHLMALFWPYNVCVAQILTLNSKSIFSFSGSKKSGSIIYFIELYMFY